MAEANPGYSLRAVKEFRLDRDNPDLSLPVANQVHSGAPTLLVDEAIRRTERIVPEPDRQPIRLRGYVVLVISIVAGAFGALVIIAEALK